jgi:hypothetical protein
MRLTRDEIKEIAEEFYPGTFGAREIAFALIIACAQRDKYTQNEKTIADLAALEERRTCVEICNDIWLKNGGALECREKILRRAA